MAPRVAGTPDNDLLVAETATKVARATACDRRRSDRPGHGAHKGSKQPSALMTRSVGERLGDAPPQPCLVHVGAEIGEGARRHSEHVVRLRGDVRRVALDLANPTQAKHLGQREMHLTKNRQRGPALRIDVRGEQGGQTRRGQLGDLLPSPSAICCESRPSEANRLRFCPGAERVENRLAEGQTGLGEHRIRGEALFPIVAHRSTLAHLRWHARWMHRPARIEPGPGQESVWDYPRPPRVEPSDELVEVVFGGVLVASTRRSLRVLETSHPPAYYLPMADVSAEHIRPSGTRPTFCEWKGLATYFTLVAGGHVDRDCAWTYTNPTKGYEAIADHLALYPGRMDECRVNGEIVTAQEGGFYGGWITSRVVGPFKGASGTWGW